MSSITIFFAFGIVISGAMVAVGYSKLIHLFTFSSDKNQENYNVEILQPIAENASALLQWIGEEKPIKTIGQDRLNNKSFAERIINVLQQPKVTITVVGSYGAGKSSILNMVKCSLRNEASNRVLNNELIPCDVCGWGLQKGSAAETILKQMIQDCAQYVDCLGISNLPAQYGKSIGHVSAWSMALSNLLYLSHDPMDALERMNKVLLAIDRRVVIFFEDLDRNWQDGDFWVEIIALLDRLKTLDQVSFVLAITEANKIGSIINRISDHIEIVPKLSYDQVSEICLNFKRLCFQDYKDKDILFNAKESRYRRIFSLDIVMQEHTDNGNLSIEDEMLQNQISYLSKIIRPDELEAVTLIIENPRNLKHALRRTYCAWKNTLHGEIEFDHLFIANVFRIAKPEVFNFIHEHLSDIQWLDLQSGEDTKKQQVREKLQKELSELINNAPMYDSVEKLIRFLFPYWMRVSGSYRVIQGFSDTKPTDYWNRMIREKLDDGEISDQVVAKAITEWKRNKDLPVYEGFSLAHAIVSYPKLPEKVLQFGELLDGQDVHVLLSQLFDYAFQVKGIRSAYVSGVKELKQLIQGKEFSGHGQWVIDEVSKLFPVNLSLANSVFLDFWGMADVSEGQRVCNALLKNAKIIYSDKEVFIKAIETHSSSVIEFIGRLGSAYKHYSGAEFNPDEWGWLADLLLDTGKSHSSIVISQILELAVYKQVELPDRPWLLNYEFIKTLFRKRQGEVMLLLSNIDVSQFAEKMRPMASVAREKSKEWLQENAERKDIPPVDSSILKNED